MTVESAAAIGALQRKEGVGCQVADWGCAGELEATRECACAEVIGKQQDG